MSKPAHHMRRHEYTHNGVKRVWWTCTAEDWDQDQSEGYTRSTWISAAEARRRFNEHLPKVKP
jgi:hypothetical protein